MAEERQVTHEDLDFHVGPLTVPFYEAHRGSYHFRDVQVHYAADTPIEMVPYFDSPEPGLVLPTKELADFRLRMIRAKKKEADEKKQGMSNGPQVGLADWRVEEEDTEHALLELWTKPSFFYEHVAFGMHLDAPELDDGNGGKTTVRAAYGQNPETYHGVLPNNIGVNTAVVTSDDQLIVMNRGGANLQYPNMLGVPAGFMMRARKDQKRNINLPRGDFIGKAPSPFATAKYETHEEAGIDAHYEDFRLLQVGRPVTGKTGDLHGEVSMMLNTKMTADQVLKAPRSGKYEGKLFAVPFEPRQVASHLWGITDKHKPGDKPAGWVPAHAALLTIVAEQKFGSDALIKALEETKPAQA